MTTQSTVAELAARFSAEVLGDASAVILGVETLSKARPGDLSFLTDASHISALSSTQATAVLINRDLISSVQACDVACTFLVVEDAQQSLIEFLQMRYPALEDCEVGISHQAFVHPSATIGEHTSIHPGAHVGANVVIGDHCEIHSGVRVGPGSRIGHHSVLHPNVVLYPRVEIGERVVIHGGAVIGADGFSYQQKDGQPEKIPQFGAVHIEDDVEIGANTTIDRSFVGVTWIGRGTKIDNLVQVAHNCELGPGNLLAAQVGLAGSVTTGNAVVFGGQVGVAPHSHLGDMAQFAAQAGVTKSVAGRNAYSGTPAQPHRDSKKQVIALRKLPELRRKIQDLNAHIKALETQLQSLADQQS